jgi:hypothetical protein
MRHNLTPQEQQAVVQKVVEFAIDEIRRSIEAHPPHSYDELSLQRFRVDMEVCSVFRMVCDVLPDNVQVTVRELLGLRDTIWHREPVPTQEQKEVQ